MKYPGILALIAFFVHFAISILLPVLYFGTVMSSFTKSSNEVKIILDVLTVLGWIWTTPTMIASKQFGITFQNGLIAIMLYWSMAVAIAVGVLARNIQSKSRSNSDN